MIRMLSDKAKPIARWGRKATGLKKTAGLPEGLIKSRVALGSKGGLVFSVSDKG